MGITCSNKKNQKKIDTTLKTQQQQTENYNHDLQYRTEEYECGFWEQIQRRWMRKKIEVTFKKENQVMYFIDGQIIEKKSLTNCIDKPQVLNNLEQIEFFEWQGKYGKNANKIGKWTANWGGKTLQEVGGYYRNSISKILYLEDGSKQGIWIEIMKNYCSECQVFELGEYQNNKKIGLWKFIYHNKKIGGGFYNQKTQKKGKWIELSEVFLHQAQVTFSGEYKNGKKVSTWDILWDNTGYQNKKIGGGQYDEGGDGIKQGNWVEISDGFQKFSQVTYNGEYKNGKKVGRWDIFYNEWFGDNARIGGGSYDEGVNGLKQGNWVEIWSGFKWDSQVTYNGQYKNDKKVGRWDIQYKEQFGDNKKIGGGSYDEGGDGIKQGNWVEISDEFNEFSQITYNGEYQNGKKVGRWDIWYKGRYSVDTNEKIGGGVYDEGGNGMKVAKWIELCNNFGNGKTKIIFSGEYKNGKKVDRWESFYKNKQIGGGSYDQGGTGIKLGKWIELSNNFGNGQEITFNGEYNNGKKVGQWIEIDLFGNKKNKQRKNDK